MEKENLYHQAIIIRVINHIFDNQLLKESLAFKGGTASSLLGFLDRISLDLDFDLLKKTSKEKVKVEIKKIIDRLGFEIKKESKKELFFVIQYPSVFLRHSLKVSIVDNFLKTNDYQYFFIPQLNKMILCQTIETMFANKLVALTDRFKRYKQLAGRDLYDIYYFFSQGYDFKREIIKERTKMNWKAYFQKLILFIKKNFNQKIIDEDLNFLLSPEKFRAIRKTLINEVIFFIERVEK